MLKRTFILLALLLLCSTIYAQVRISGVVTSADDNEPIPFANVVVKGTTKGVSTDVNGKYILENIPENAVLIFSSIGFQSLEVNLNGRFVINVRLEMLAESLDQVMVVAYGTAKKSTFTGSAAVVNEEAFNLRPITEITQALTATTPGVQVGTSNGQPGSEPTVRIRGIGSFNASNSPLIILDGMPYDNAFSSINPSDIESVTVLKDASSASLYGARGANGVLLINTKKGKVGKPKVTVKYNLGLTSRQSADYELLGEKDYMELYWETQRNTFVLNGYSPENAASLAGSALLAGMGYNPYLMDASTLFDANGKLNPSAVNHWKEDLDWYGAITQLGKRHDSNISISGANESTDYYTSLGYMKEEGYVIGSQFERISAKANINSKITKWLKVGSNLNMSYSTSEGEQTETSGANSNPFRFVRYIGNIFPIHLHDPSTGEYIYDANGNKMHDFGLGWQSADGSVVVQGRDAFPGNNHALEVHNIYNGYLRQTINIKGYAEVSLAKGLKFTANAGLGSNMYRSWNGGYVYEQKGNAGSSSKNVSGTTTWTFQQLFNYSKNFGKHHLDVLAGHESYKYEYHYMSTSMKTQTIIGSNFEYANFVEVNALPNSYTHNYRVEGFLSRVNYDFDEKYFASASYRRDGSSRFYRDVRWGNFWSIGVGWTVDKEPFMAGVKFVDLLKIRASYGVVGNDDLASYYPWRAAYSVNNNGEPGYVQSSLGNSSLTWETSSNFDVATEFRLLNGRLDGSLEYFNRMSSDLLFSVPQPISSGVTDVDVNAGSMYNRGLEMVLNGMVFRKNDFSLTLTGNATYIENKITDLPLEPYTSYVYKIEEGHSRYDFWLRQWGGVNPATGYNLFKPDTDLTFEDGELLEIGGEQYTENIAKSKYDYSGSGIPSLTGGIAIERTTKMHINVHVARAIKARVLLTQGKWLEAAAMAKLVTVSSGAVMDKSCYDYKQGRCCDATNKEWIWAKIAQPELETATLFNFYSYISNTNISYNRNTPRAIYNLLYKRISNTDVRKALWVENVKTSTNLVFPPKGNRYKWMSQKFIVDYPDNASASYSGAIITADLAFVRLPEMFLIMAEGYARGGNEVDARIALHKVAADRDPMYVLSSNSGEALIDEVMFQRRVELWGEGFRWLDLKRLNMSLDRGPAPRPGYNQGGAVNNWKSGQEPTNLDPLASNFNMYEEQPIGELCRYVAAGAKEWQFVIPQLELDYNPLCVQNPL